MVTFPASAATNPSVCYCGTACLGPGRGGSPGARLSLEVLGGQLGQSGHVLAGTGATSCVPGAGTHLDGQAQLGATGCMSPNGCLCGVTRVPWSWSSKGRPGTGGPRACCWPAALVLWPQGPGSGHGDSCSGTCVFYPRPHPPTPLGSPGLLLALLECRRRGCGGQPGAWHLVIKSSGVDCSWRLQDGCGFEGAAPRGLGQPPTGSAAQASASPSWPLCHSIPRSEGLPGESPPPFSEGEGIVRRDSCALGDCRDRVDSQGLGCGCGEGSPRDTCRCSGGSIFPNAVGLGPGCPQGSGSDLQGRRGCMGERSIYRRSGFPARPGSKREKQEVGGTAVRAGGGGRARTDPGADTSVRPGPSRSLSAAECPLPLLPATAIARPEATRRASPALEFHRPRCQLGLTLPLPVSPGRAEGGPGCSPGRGGGVSRAMGPVVDRFLPSL